MSWLLIVLCVAIAAILVRFFVAFFCLCRNASAAEKHSALAQAQGASIGEALSSLMTTLEHRDNFNLDAQKRGHAWGETINKSQKDILHNLEQFRIQSLNHTNSTDEILMDYQPTVAASILEEHFTKKRNQDGLMLMKSIRDQLLSRKSKRKAIDKKP